MKTLKTICENSCCYFVVNMKSAKEEILKITLCIGLAVGITACNAANTDDNAPQDRLPQKIGIIDAGSSGSRLHIYEVRSDSTIQQIYPSNDTEKKESKGMAISTIANHPDSVKAYFDQMTLCYKKSSDDVIPLYILATAGMRMQEKAETESIYAKLNSIGQANGFKLNKAMTIAGRYEGLYAWIAANYENGTLESSSKGIVEIGGVSAQIAFVANTTGIPEDNKITRRNWGTIYSKSYLGGGMNWVYDNTEDTEPFKFSVPLEDISAYYGEDLTFFGCSSGLEKALKGIEKEGSFEAYTATLPRNDRYHNYMFAYYMKWLFENLHLTDKVTPAPDAADWPEGAAYDIIINKEQPECFDYDKKL